MTRIAFVQQIAGTDKKANLERGLQALESAATCGANLVCFRIGSYLSTRETSE